MSIKFDKLRRQDADTAQKLEELQRDERALRLELGRCQQALGEGAVAADQAAAASQRAMEDLEAKKLAEEERLSGELRTSQYEARRVHLLQSKATKYRNCADCFYDDRTLLGHLILCYKSCLYIRDVSYSKYVLY